MHSVWLGIVVAAVIVPIGALTQALRFALL
jgi:hypothetical protein